MEIRPDRPDPALLNQARTTLAERRSIDTSNLAWVVGDRMVRKRSTLFHLTLGDVATAFYKAPYYPEDQQDSRHLERARSALSRGQSLANRLADLVGSDVAVNVTLASNPDTLESITLGLEGEPMGNPLRLILTGSRRSEALATCRRVGEAMRALESIDDAAGPAEGIIESAGRKLESAAGHLTDGQIRRLGTKLGELFQSATEEGGVVVAHGDLSPGNVILMDNKTGLIDFLWTTQLRGFDVSRFVHRLRYATVSYPYWTENLVAATLKGYGGPETTDRPGWQFSEIMHMLTTVQRLDRRGQMRRGPGKRALAGLRAVAGVPLRKKRF